MPPNDPYRLLGLHPNASLAEIRVAYRRLAKKAHPDAPGGSQEAFLTLRVAFELLCDPQKRQSYDEGDFAQFDEELEKQRRAQLRRRRNRLRKLFE